jgi:hypothetical protein
MPKTDDTVPGWLFREIESAVQDVAKKGYVTQDVVAKMERAVSEIRATDLIMRKGGSLSKPRDQLQTG